MSVALMTFVAALGFAAATSLTIRLALPRLRRLLARLPAPRRARVVFGLLAAPLLIGISLSLVATLPGLLAALSPALDHCAHHDDDHFHLCLVHGPAHVHAGRIAIATLVLLTPVALALSRVGSRLRRGRRLVARLDAAATRTDDGYALVPDDTPLAVTAGVWRPRVYVTQGLLRTLDPQERRVVLAHEAAHARRADPRRKLFAQLLGALHLPGARNALLADLELSCERACDEAAATEIGDRPAVAATLVRLGRMASAHAMPSAPHLVRFGEGDLEARVHGLLAPVPPTPRLPSPRVAALAVVVLAAIVMSPVHHVTETVLGALFG